MSSCIGEILVGAKEIWNKARFVVRMMDEERRENAVTMSVDGVW